MSDIEKAVQSAIEEFVGDAYQRFLVSSALGHNKFGDYIPLTSQGLLVSIIEKSPLLLCKYKLKTKPLSELFAHDMIFYINAFEMWEVRYGYGSEWQSPESFENELTPNKTVEHFLGCGYGLSVRRKQSAALPFNLERAKAGDVVECRKWGAGDSSWQVMSKLNSIALEETYYTNYFKNKDPVYNKFHEEDLRMKYPPKKVQS